MSKLTAIIKKQRMIDYPYGRDLAGLFNLYLFNQVKIINAFTGVQYEYTTKHQNYPNTAYIRYVHNDGINILIICFSKDQALQFQSLETFQMDLTFKRIFGEVNELVLATFNEQSGKGISFQYI